MKNTLLIIMLALLGMQSGSFAQNQPLSSRTATQVLFDDQNWFLKRHHFLITLKNKNKVDVYVNNKTDLHEIINLDSLIKAVAQEIKPFTDTIQDGVFNTKIDYREDQDGKIKVRVRQFTPVSNSYVLQNDGPALLKIEQDTLTITRFKPVTSTGRITGYYQVVVIVNDIRRLNEITDGTINTAMQDFKQQWDNLKKWKPQKNSNTNLFAHYNVPFPSYSVKMREPYASDYRTLFTAYFQVALQNLNSEFVNSAGAGFQIIRRKKMYSTIRYSSDYENRYQLFWEPYFIFDKSTTGKTRMHRNDFITFQYTTEFNSTNLNNSKIQYAQNFSASYLVHRSGEFFQKNTFKFGLPGAKFKFLHLHPEFVFNDLFKNFQPGLKIFLDLD